MDNNETCPSDISEIGKASGCLSCPGRDFCLAEGQGNPNQNDIDVRMKAIKYKIVILSGKGGVGKSTLTASLAKILAHTGRKVGLLDVDLCGPSLPQIMNVGVSSLVTTKWGWQPIIVPGSNIKLVSAASILANKNESLVFRGPRKSQLITRFLKDVMWGRLDYLLIDTPPGTSDEHLSIAKLLQKHLTTAILITSPQPLAMKTAEKEIDFCRKLKIPIMGVVENMAYMHCPCCQSKNSLFEGDISNFCQKHNLKLLGRIPFSLNLSQACDEGLKSQFDDTNHEPVFDSLKQISQLVMNLT